jgi:hypothetical protein
MKKSSLNVKDKLILDHLIHKYYSNAEKCNENDIITMHKIIMEKYKLSLRFIHWYVTIFSKINNKKIYQSYYAHQCAYGKKYFDPFRRGILINVTLRDNINVNTTVGQLTFFKWLFEFNIINFIMNEYENIHEQFRMYNDEKNNIKKIKQNEVKNEFTDSISEYYWNNNIIEY